MAGLEPTSTSGALRRDGSWNTYPADGALVLTDHVGPSRDDREDRAIAPKGDGVPIHTGSRASGAGRQNTGWRAAWSVRAAAASSMTASTSSAVAVRIGTGP